jgi:hypothetical protein
MSEVRPPATANLSPDQVELEQQIAAMTKEFSVDALAKLELPTPRLRGAKIAYTKTKMENGNPFTETIDFLVAPDGVGEGIADSVEVNYQRSFGERKQPKSSEAIREQFGAIVDTSIDGGRVSSMGVGQQPARLHEKLSELKQSPGLVSVTYFFGEQPDIASDAKLKLFK